MNARHLVVAALVFATPGAAVAATGPRAVVQASFEAFNRHDARAMAALYAEDAVLMSSDFCAPRIGRAEVERTYAELFAQLPDVRDGDFQFVSEGDRVAVKFIARSARAGMALPIAAFLTVKGGRIVHDDAVFDNGGAPCKK